MDKKTENPTAQKPILLSPIDLSLQSEGWLRLRASNIHESLRVTAKRALTWRQDLARMGSAIAEELDRRDSSGLADAIRKGIGEAALRGYSAPKLFEGAAEETVY